MNNNIDLGRGGMFGLGSDDVPAYTEGSNSVMCHSVERDALVVVDVQQDFANPVGSLYVKDAEQVIPVINMLTAEAMRRNVPTFFSRDWHPENTPHFDKWPVHCVAGTPGAGFANGLVVPQSANIVSKGLGLEVTDVDGYSAANGTLIDGSTLAEALRAASINSVTVVGLATDYCVKATAIDLANAGFYVTVVHEAIRAVNIQPNDGRDARRAMQDAGVSIVKILGGVFAPKQAPAPSESQAV